MVGVNQVAIREDAAFCDTGDNVAGAKDVIESFAAPCISRRLVICAMKMLYDFCKVVLSTDSGKALIISTQQLIKVSGDDQVVSFSYPLCGL